MAKPKTEPKQIKMTEDQIVMVCHTMMLKDRKILEVNRGDIELKRESFAVELNKILNCYANDGIKISDLIAMEDVLQQFIARIFCVKIAQTISSLSKLEIVPRDLSAIEFVAEKIVDFNMEHTKDYQLTAVRDLAKEIMEDPYYK